MPNFEVNNIEVEEQIVEIGPTDANEQLNYGVAFYTGNGEEQNYRKAVYWFNKAAEQGIAEAQFLLGSCYENKVVFDKDVEVAAQWYEKAANQGHAEAQYHLGLLYYPIFSSIGHNSVKAVYWFNKAADQEHAHAQNMLGECYYKGRGVKKNYEKAVYWFRKAADQGNADAQRNLGNCYWKGEGVKVNEKIAVNLYKKSASQGNLAAIGELSGVGLIRVMEGIGNLIGLNSNKAKVHLKFEALDDNDKIDVVTMVKNEDNDEYEIVETGKTIIDDKIDVRNEEFKVIDHQQTSGNESIKPSIEEQNRFNELYKLANNGDAAAQNDLGVCYFNGTDYYEKNYDEAAKWFFKSANNNSPFGQYNYANLVLLKGKCVENNNVKYIDSRKGKREARYWLEISAANGFEKAKILLKELNEINTNIYSVNVVVAAIVHCYLENIKGVVNAKDIENIKSLIDSQSILDSIEYGIDENIVIDEYMNQIDVIVNIVEFEYKTSLSDTAKAIQNGIKQAIERNIGLKNIVINVTIAIT